MFKFLRNKVNDNNNMKPIKAIIFGATGLAGSAVLQECLKSSDVVSVTIIVRRHTGIYHEKIKEIVHDDYLDFSAVEENLKGFNACFYCLGVSQIDVGDEPTYKKITYDYTFAAVKSLLKFNKKLIFCFLSGMGTDQTMKSRLMWARIKGKTENDLGLYDFEKLFHFRPGLIYPQKGLRHSTTTTKITKPLYPILNKLFPSFILNTTEFGKAMINAVIFEPELSIFENIHIRDLAKK